MTDYQQYINALRKCAKEHENDSTFTGHVIVSDLCRDTANLLETVQPKTGHWIDKSTQSACGIIFYRIECSECGKPSGLSHTSANYCPNCGAKMEVVEG